jgi:hypothetical protein
MESGAQSQGLSQTPLRQASSEGHSSSALQPETGRGVSPVTAEMQRLFSSAKLSGGHWQTTVRNGVLSTTLQSCPVSPQGLTPQGLTHLLLMQTSLLGHSGSERHSGRGGLAVTIGTSILENFTNIIRFSWMDSNHN